MATYFVLCNDLFLKAKIMGRIKQENFPEDADILLVDLEHPDAFTMIERFQKKCIAFCSHVRQDLIRKAAEKGVKAYPRSQFFSKVLPELS